MLDKKGDVDNLISLILNGIEEVKGLDIQLLDLR